MKNINRRGVTRLVILRRRTVIKIPNFTHSWLHFIKGLVANINEKQTWAYNTGPYEQGHSHLLAPVVWMSWGGWILVMRRCQEITREQWEEVSENDRHREHMRAFGGDDGLDNYGYLDGRLVKLDYGELQDVWGEDFKARNTP